MDLNHIEAIIFDAEGVVVNTEKLWDKSQEILLGKRGLAYDRDFLKPRMAGRTLLEGAGLMVDYYGLDEAANIIEQERKKIIHNLFEREIFFIDGFLSFIDSINGTKLKKSIATAMEKKLMVKVENKLNLKQYFGEHIYFIEDVANKSKPAPDVFLLAADKMGVDPASCVVIEDAPNGIEAANRGGMISVGLTTTFTRKHLVDADFIADNFDEILQFLRDGAGLYNLKNN